MNPTNAESEALRAWRDQKTNQYGTDSNLHRGIGHTSQKNGNQSISVGRAIWARTDSICESTGSNAGGIVSQLIERTCNQLEKKSNQLGELESEIEELHQNLNALKELQKQLEAAEELQEHTN